MGNVTKKDLVEEIAGRTGLTQVDTKIVVESFLEAMATALKAGNNIEIRGFGRFKIKRKKARTARNPRTNEYIQVEEGYKPIFEASRELRKRVDTAYRQGVRSDEQSQQELPVSPSHFQQPPAEPFTPPLQAT
ncbi:integration host factor subunit beta [bacterium]|nr:integration host factor subunit beta [bacterium]MBD3243147.1 integration host factor subunit beta [Chitinivibrionales bacterium]